MKKSTLTELRKLYEREPTKELEREIQKRQRAILYKQACKYIDAHKLGESNTFAGAGEFVELVYNSDKAPEPDAAEFEIPSKYTRSGWGARKVYFD